MYETIVRDGVTPHRIAEGHEKQQLLLGKLSELVGAYRVDGGVEHLADMVEVAMTLSADHPEALTEAIVQRIEALGSFAAGHVISVDEAHTHGGAISAQVSVKAACWQDGQLLCVKKQPNFGDQWEIAGGRLGGGDDPDVVIRKEILEELSIQHPTIGAVIATGFADPLPGFLPMFYFIPRNLRIN